MAADHERKDNPEVSQKQLWFGVAAGPVIWSLHLLLVYPLVSLACERGLLRGEIFGVAAVRLVLILVTLAALALVGAGGYAAYRLWQELGANRPARELASDGPAQERGQVEGRIWFMARAGVIVSIFFFGIIALMLVPMLVLDLCG